jgi:signal transduction histidine kinase
MSWWQRRSVTVRDAAGAVPIVLLFVLVEQISGDGRSLAHAIVVVLIMGLALGLRRRWPIVTFVTALLTVAVAMTGLVFLAVAGYTLVAYDARARPAVVAGVSALAATVGFMRWWPAFVLQDVAGDLAILAVVSVLPVVVGRAVRASRLWTAELETQNAELVALRGKTAEHAVQSERLRIARELHDVVAHHVSAITVRARAGHHVAPRDPQAAADALAYIAGAGTKAGSADRLEVAARELGVPSARCARTQTSAPATRCSSDSSSRFCWWSRS